MDAVIAIFKQLGVDNTIITQFSIALITFISLKVLLFDKLLDVLETREKKTVKLERDAIKMSSEADELATKYSKELNEAYAHADKVLTEKKQKISDFEKSKILEREKVINKEIESKRGMFVSELASKKQEIFSEEGTLAKQLLNKLTK